MKVLLDTNVLIAAFITQGVCSDLLEHCLRRHEIVLSEFILDELRNNLLDKFKFERTEVETVEKLLRSRSTIYQPVLLTRPVCRDADDDSILGTAVAGHATCIITGDKHLLVIKEYQGIAILKPSEFLSFEAGY